MFGFGKKENNGESKPKKIRPKISFSRPGESVEDFKKRKGITDEQESSSIQDLFDAMGKDEALKFLKRSGVKIEDLVAAGALSEEDLK